MKKICFVTTISVTLDAFFLSFAKYMYKNGNFDIYFICNPDEKFKNKLPKYIHFIPVTMKRGVGVDVLKVVSELVRIFKKNKFDIVQYSTPNASCYASIASKIANVPVRLYCQWGIAYVGFEGIKRKILKQVEKIVCSLSTCIEPDSNSNLKFAIAEGLYSKEKGHVVWNGSASGVPLDKFNITKKEEYNIEIRKQLNINSNDFVYGFVGRITCDKGINEIFTAFQKIENQDYMLKHHVAQGADC